jgi:nitronate monooxygenase/enoyl-[acyl-carrier protein] reductase II
MIRTVLCDVLGIEHPIIQGPLGGPWPPSVELVAAVSNAGALGSLPTALRSPHEVRADIAAVRERTEQPFAVNHTFRPFVEEVFQAVLDAAPPVISVALGPPGDLPQRAHDAGARYVHQVHRPDQAMEAAGVGADVVIAQGDEAGGFGGADGTMVLVPQVVDAVPSVPVAAAGGIVDGRGMAAALVLGAQGVNVGTRFMASEEASIPKEYQEAVLAARSQETARVLLINELVPPAAPHAYPGSPRVLRASFVERLLGDPERARAEIEALRDQMRAALAEGRGHELLPVMGEAAGSVRSVRPAADIVREMLQEAETILGAAAELVS